MKKIFSVFLVWMLVFASCRGYAEEDPAVPKTGDRARPLPWLICALLGALGLSAARVFGKARPGRKAAVTGSSHNGKRP